MSATVPCISLPPEFAGEPSSSAIIRGAAGRGDLTVFRKPATPDPLVNATLTSLGTDADGRERFWTSSVNSLCGATSFLVDEEGEYRAYPWPIDDDIRAVYSVAADGDDTLWVTGGALGHFIRLDLSSGDWARFPWGGGRFVTAGMALDPETGKLFCGAQTALLSFDTRACRTTRVYGPDECPPDNHHYDHWRLSDGSYGFLLVTPGLSFLRWDPASEAISWRRLIGDRDHPAIPLVRALNYTDGDRAYVPYLGWLDGLTGELTPHDHPPRQEASWFAHRGSSVYGSQPDRATGSVRVVVWDTTAGSTRPLLTAPDTTPQGLALSRRGKVLVADVYGAFRRFDGHTGQLERTRQIGIVGEHLCNAIVPVDATRVAGTPFISQNFWVMDTDTGQRRYGGRAGGSFGQVDFAVRAGGRVYFAIYGGGQLTEYDPDSPANFPRNPRLVAACDQGQHGAGIASDGQVIWTAFRPRYGTLDGAMIRYDTGTGEARYRIGALPSRHVVDPVYDPASGQLVGGSSCLSDCETATPTCDTASAVRLDPGTMEIIASAEAPSGTATIRCCGPLGADRWLFRTPEEYCVFDLGEARLTPWAGAETPPVAAATAWSGTPARFLVQADGSLVQWDAICGTLDVLAGIDETFVRRWWVHGADLTFDCGRHAAIWRGAVTP